MCHQICFNMEKLDFFQFLIWVHNDFYILLHIYFIRYHNEKEY